MVRQFEQQSALGCLHHRLVNRANGKALDTGGQNSNGSLVQQWYVNASHNQQWEFVAP
ncbi:MAG: RICIN domain-containing protein [Verrucomicrobiota bacterium]